MVVSLEIMFRCVENLVAKYCVVIVVETNTTKHRSSCLKVLFNGLTIILINIIYVVQEGRAVQRVFGLFLNPLRCARGKSRSKSLVALVCHPGFYGSFRVGAPGFFDVVHSLLFWSFW